MHNHRGMCYTTSVCVLCVCVCVCCVCVVVASAFGKSIVCNRTRLDTIFYNSVYDGKESRQHSGKETAGELWATIARSAEVWGWWREGVERRVGVCWKLSRKQQQIHKRYTTLSVQSMLYPFALLLFYFSHYCSCLLLNTSYENV